MNRKLVTALAVFTIAGFLMASMSVEAASAVKNTSIDFANVNGWVAKGAQNDVDGKLTTDETSHVIRYTFHFFDRNGESDLNADHDFRFTIYGPDGSGNSQTTTALTNPAASQVSLSTGTCGGTFASGAVTRSTLAENGGAAGNGILQCYVEATYNSGGATPPGTYTVKADLLAGGTSTVQDSLEIVSAVYDVVSSAAVAASSYSGGWGADAGAIDWGSAKNPWTDTTAADTYTATQYIRVSNTAGSDLGITLDFTDLTDGTTTILDDYIAVDGVVQTDGAAPSGFSAHATDVNGVHTLNNVGPGQQGVFEIQLINVLDNVAGTNDVIADGTYTGTVTITLSGGVGGAYTYDGGTFNPVNPDGSISVNRKSTPTDGFATIAGDGL